ncbi:S-layer homology domain-containing protein [uncultured Ruthenibacterium sp.]|uniref:S-layer homology domain-containing protein n=1 Tax=uncultured Ruthenibacterium sp. TaxID=1905347 RepID=UPI00349E5D76
MKKIFALCMSAALLLQTCPVAFAASAKPPITMQAIATEMKIEDQVIEDSAGSQVTVKYDTIGSAMKDIADGVVTDADGIVCTLDSTEPCKIYIKQSTSSAAYVEQISEKVIISADSIETAEVSDSEITLHFQDIEIAVDTGKQAVQNAITFSGGLEVQSGASLTLGNNVNISQHIINYTFGSDVVVAGELTFDGNMNHDSSVIFSEGAALTVQETGTASIGHVKVSGGSDEQPLITVAEGGTLNVSAPDMGSEGGTIEAAGTAIQNNGGTLNLGSGTIKSTSNDSSVPVISSNGGEVNLKITQETDSQTPPTMSVEGAPAISVTGDATLTVEEGSISNTTGAPAVTVGEGATVVIPEDSKAEIKSEGGNAAIDLAPGASVQQGGNTITVAPVEDESASNYVDNFGNVVLTSGGKNDKGDIPANTVIQPDGTAITGNNGVLPEVGDNGNVTIPEGGATITNPEGDKVEVGNGAEIPSIVIGVKDAETGKVETSKRIELGDGTLALETAVFDSEIDLKDYTCTVASDKETVATAELKDGKIVVTPVSTGTATITATYTKNSGAAEGIALLDEGEATAENDLTATFTVEVYKESSGGGGGGGSSSSTTYAVSVEDSKNGSVSVSPKRAEKGDTVTITVKPDKGYELDELIVTDKNGDKIKLTEKDDNKFTFKMPGSKVTVETSFKLIETEPENPFTDISKSDYFYDAVLWAADKGVTSGVTDTLFAPNASCTRAQMVTFLWRANGSPVVDYAMNFTDVPADAYYADAVRWAVSKGITSGTSATTFAPDMTVTRAQTVTFLYRAAGTPAVSGGSFADVDANAYYADAVAWAVAEDITSGTSATTFSPDAACTRGQIVTFLYRAQ